MNFVLNKKIIYLAIAVVGILFFLRPLETKAAVSNDGLIGYWTMDNNDFFGSTLYDRSGKGKTATYQGRQSSTSTPSPMHQARNFSGNPNDFFTLGNDTISTTEIQNGTITALIRTTSSTDQTTAFARTIFDIEAWITFGINSTGSLRCFTNGNSASGLAFTDPYLVNDGRWHHVACSWSSTGSSDFTRLYIDGILRGSNNVSAPNPDSTASRDPTIGVDNINTPARPYAGDIDEVRLYNRALSTQEIANMYTSQKSGLVLMSTPTNKQLLAHWSMDNADSRRNTTSTTFFDNNSGFKNNLTTFPRQATSTIGKIKQAMTFDGANGYASSTSVFTPRTNSLTVSAWVRPRSYSASGSSTIMAADDGNPVWGCRIDNTTKKLSMFVRDNAAVIIDAISTSTIQTSRWTHITCVWDFANERATSYIDGRLENQITKTSIDSTTIAQYVNLVGLSSNNGAPYTSQADYFNGEIDDMRVYNYAMSKVEVQQIYKTSGISITKTNNIFRNLMGYWTMDDNDFFGSTLYDRSGKGTNLRLLGNTPTSTPGKIGQARNLGASKTDYFTSANDVTTTAEVNKGSVLAWVRTTSSTSRQGIFSDEGWLVLEMNTTGTIYCQSNGTDSARAFSDPYIVNDGKWHLVGCTWINAQFTRVYVDGKLRGNNALSNSQPGFQAGRAITIGREIIQITNGGHFDGDIDNVMYFSRALSAGEMEQLYNAGRTLKIK